MRSPAVLLLGSAACLLLPSALAGQERCPEVANPLAEEGWAAFREDRLAAARELFSGALERCPSHQSARTGLAYVDLREGSDEAAAAGFQEVIRDNPRNIDALTGLGILAWRRGDLEEVGRLFRRVRELDPDDPAAAEYLGRLSPGERPASEGEGLQAEADAAWSLGDTEAAARLYRAILAADSTDTRALHRLALILAWSGDYDQALELFSKVLAMEPGNVEARVARARVRAWQGDLDEAALEVDELLASHPDHPLALEARAQFQSWAGEYSAAVAAYEQVAGISPDPTGVLLARAQVLGWASRSLEAEAAYDSILALNPGNLEARLGQARSLRWQGRPAAALAVLEAAPANQRNNPELTEQLRWVRAALYPRTGFSMTREGDSDENAMTTGRVNAGWNPVPRLSVQGEAYARDLDQEGIGLSRSSWGASLTASYQVEPGWTVTAGAGGTRTDGSGPSSFVSARAALASPDRYPLVGALAAIRSPLDETAQLVEQGVEVSLLDLSARWRPVSGWLVSLSGGAGSFEGDERNRRLHATARVDHRLTERWTLGLSHRYFGFQKDLQEYYFDPDYFGLTEIAGGWVGEAGRWGLRLEAAPGLQVVGSGGDPSAALRASAGLTFRLSPGRELALSGGYSSAGLQSFSSGDSDYRYGAVAISGQWVFY